MNAIAACEEAKIHHENLVEQRKELNQQLRKAQEKIDRLTNLDQPPRKVLYALFMLINIDRGVFFSQKMSLGGGRSSESDDSNCQLVAELKKEIGELKTEVDLRYEISQRGGGWQS